MIKNINYYWDFSPNIWRIIILGWIVVVVSAIFKFDFPSSGAVLSCCVIVAEIMFNQWVLYKNFEEFATEEGRPGLPRFFRRRIRELAKDGEENWMSARRIFNNIHRILAFNLVCGTLIWGYGHHFIKQV